MRIGNKNIIKSRLCIFCDKKFLNAPPEHVIPKSIGGQYTIHSVCEKCNGELNKKIDEPFKDHKLISIYRFIFSTKGRSKKVQNPLSGEYIAIDGIEYSVKMNEDLTVNATMRPKFPKISELKLGETFRIEIDEKNIEQVESYRKKVAEKFDIPLNEIQIRDINKTYIPESNHVIKTDNNIVLLEFSKILYQTASDLIGTDFTKDPIAIKYREMLKSGVLDESIKEYISPHQDITNQVFIQLLQTAQSLKHKHLIILSGFVGVGLVGFLKIYDSYHVQILSSSNSFHLFGMKIVLNDFKNKNLGIYEPNKLPNCNVNINPVHIEKQEHLLNNEFQNNPPDLEYPILDAQRKLIAKSLFEFVHDFRFQRTIETDFTTFMNVTVYFNELINIRSKSTDLLIPIESATYNYVISTLKRR